MLNSKRYPCHDEEGEYPLWQFLSEGEAAAQRIAGDDIAKQQDQKDTAGDQNDATCND